MEQFEASIESARNNIKVADHMLVITYPLVKDPKLLLLIIEKIHSALDEAMSSVLYFERAYKRIGSFNDTDFDSRLNAFRSEIVPRFRIRNDFISLMQEIRGIIREHKKSPVEFSRRENFVICSDNYKVRSLSADVVKRYVAKAKEFIYEMGLLVVKR